LAPGEPQRRKKDEDFTQTLQLPPEPPAALAADEARLRFLVTPLSDKGLMSQQVRDGVKSLLKMAGGATVVKIRAYVAGTGDLRRVQQIVAEEFAAKRLSQPVVSAVLAGALPRTGAQAQLEGWTQEKKTRHAHGVEWLGARPAEQIPVRALRVVCFTDSLERAGRLRQRFSSAALVVVQPRRVHEGALDACEAVVERSAGTPRRVVVTGSQMAFGFTAADARLAFERLEKTLASAGSGAQRMVLLDVFPLSGQLAQLAEQAGGPWPAQSVVVVEGLASMDAAFALEAVAEIP
jgi:enamine deaminase RidA (YjgF/YER057c/UK114 family)